MRKNFPTLYLNKNYIYLDNAATSLKLGSVIKKMDFFTKKFPLNLHSSSGSDDHLLLETTIRNSRELIAKWINGKVTEISFVPSTTYALNFLALSLAELVKTNYSVAITKVEHSSNTYPWINLSRKKNLKLNYLWLDSQFSIDRRRISEKVNSSTIVVSFAQLSNTLGSLNNVKEITKTIKSINSACYVIVDACQSISNTLIDVKDWGIDALVFSSHKFYGPDGIAVLWIKETFAKKLPNLLWGGGQENFSFSSSGNLISGYKKFEVGTISTSHIAGLGEVFNFISKFNWVDLISKQRRLKIYTVNSLLKVAGIKIYNIKTKSNILLFNIEGFHSQDISLYLVKNKIFVRAGSFCSPFLRELIGTSSAVRLSLAVYNNRREIDILVNHLHKIRVDSCLE